MRSFVNLSLQGRLRIAAGLVLAAFLGLTGLVLDHGFRQNADAALRERLEAHVYALLAVAELDAAGHITLPRELAAPRFAISASGLYADVGNSEGKTLWRSRSTLGVDLPDMTAIAVGDWQARRLRSGDTVLATLSFGSSWLHSDNSERRFVFRVSEDLSAHNTRLADYRRNLWGGLAATTLLLLIVQGLILRWSLRPLRRAVRELKSIESGAAEQMSSDYPRELAGLTTNLNRLLASTRAQLTRYREGLANLAHSLKTPMAVLRGALDDNGQTGAELRNTALEQLHRMQTIVDYQLQHAAAAGRNVLAPPVAIAAIADKIIHALQKVHADRHIQVDNRIAAGMTWRIDEGDLYELLGNVIENAFKYCRSRVQVSAGLQRDNDRQGASLQLCIEDDGPGIEQELAGKVLERGFRADSRQEGQGLGLTMVRDIVRLYDGELTIEASALGGAKLILSLR